MASSRIYIQPCIQDYNMIDEVQALATQLKQVIKENEKQIMEEFMDYCTSQLPSGLAKCSVELYWHKISLIKDVTDTIPTSLK